MALATCAAFSELDPDDRILLQAPRQSGVEAGPAVWDDPDINWEAFALTVVRETWDYSFRREEFLAWTRRVPRLLNAADVIAWNTDKRYLRDLEQRGIPVVPTAWLEPGSEVDGALLDGDVVVKPAVSGGSRDTERYGCGEHAAAVAHVQRLLAGGRTVMVQPYMASVDRRGETAIVYIAGTYSHAVTKDAILVRRNVTDGALFAEERVQVREPTAPERELGERILDSLPWPRNDLIHGRIDVVEGDCGAPLLLELELAEPSLFLAHSATAAQRMALAITARIHS